MAYHKFAALQPLYAFITKALSTQTSITKDLDKSSLLLSAALSKALSKKPTRILILSSLDVKPIAYTPLMNCLFAAKKAGIRIDCIGGRRESDVIDLDHLDVDGDLIERGLKNMYFINLLESYLKIVCGESGGVYSDLEDGLVEVLVMKHLFENNNRKK